MPATNSHRYAWECKQPEVITGCVDTDLHVIFLQELKKGCFVCGICCESVCQLEKPDDNACPTVIFFWADGTSRPRSSMTKSILGANRWGENNKLIFAIGLLGGSGRLSSSGRCPPERKVRSLKGLKRAMRVGITGYCMSNLGLRAIILEGISADKNRILEIGRESVRLLHRPGLAHKNVYETARLLQAEYGRDWGLIAIGPAGEMGLASACICNADQDGIPGRANGRGGLGAVMGSKRAQGDCPGTRSRMDKHPEKCRGDTERP